MVGSLILTKVPGAIIEKGVLEEFSAKKFNFKPPVNFKIRIANLGNVHFKPQGDITIKNWRGKALEKISINSGRGNVLPDSIRKFEEKWQASRWAFGRFSANLNLTYGENEKTLNSKIIFWIIPWWAIVIFALIIVLIIFTIWIIRKRRKRRGKTPSITRIQMG